MTFPAPRQQHHSLHRQPLSPSHALLALILACTYPISTRSSEQDSQESQQLYPPCVIQDTYPPRPTSCPCGPTNVTEGFSIVDPTINVHFQFVAYKGKCLPWRSKQKRHQYMPWDTECSAEICCLRETYLLRGQVHYLGEYESCSDPEAKMDNHRESLFAVDNSQPYSPITDPWVLEVRDKFANKPPSGSIQKEAPRSFLRSIIPHSTSDDDTGLRLTAFVSFLIGLIGSIAVSLLFW